MLQNHFLIYALPQRLKELGFVQDSMPNVEVFEYGQILDRVVVVFTHPDLPDQPLHLLHNLTACGFSHRLFSMTVAMKALYSISEAKELADALEQLVPLTYFQSTLLRGIRLMTCGSEIRSVGIPSEYLEPPQSADIELRSNERVSFVRGRDSQAETSNPEYGQSVLVRAMAETMRGSLLAAIHRVEDRALLDAIGATTEDEE